MEKHSDGQMQNGLLKSFGQTTDAVFHRTAALSWVFIVGPMLDDEIRTFAEC